MVPAKRRYHGTHCFALSHVIVAMLFAFFTQSSHAQIDFGPIDNHDVLANIHRYTYPPCAITQRVGAMFKLADFPCLLTSEPVTATLMTHAVSLHPETAMAPLAIDKDWGTTNYRFINMGLNVKGAGADEVVGYEQWTKMV